MQCCGRDCKTSGIGDFFSKEADKFLKRYRKRGFEKSQKNLFEGIVLNGVENKSILEIGCGVGTFHGELLKKGGSRVTGVDLSSNMIEVARKYSREIGMEGRTSYHVGDFVDIANEIEKSDITILDKVICCYPDMNDLVQKSLSKTNKTYAFTLPRDKWWVKFPMEFVIGIMKLFKSSFRPYFHPHEDVIRHIQDNGFQKVYQKNVFFWETYVFSRNSI